MYTLLKSVLHTCNFGVHTKCRGSQIKYGLITEWLDCPVGKLVNVSTGPVSFWSLGPAISLKSGRCIWSKAARADPIEIFGAKTICQPTPIGYDFHPVSCSLRVRVLSAWFKKSRTFYTEKRCASSRIFGNVRRTENL